jgi:hypothetical protein
LDRLRCNLCGEVFTAPEPEGVGPETYDETAAAMIALLKYGSGMPFYRLEKLEHLLGIPLPASTQGEIAEEEAEVIKAALDELIRQAAQGEVLHNDDTGMRVLRLTTRGRKPARCFAASRPGSGYAPSDVRCVVAQYAQTRRRRPDPAGELFGARKKAVRGGRGELPGSVPLCSRNIAQRI